ncbi:hypothetical protein [Desulfosporosinus sp. FKA]|uniref:hypothetical protein n=1 Tax=Desulfosporosinus sp. FKA TaxID=1969834 RepID=UPI000B4A1DB2|nr:hypothetical protein [Desulfosporosinus sp. FKA]
MGTVISVIEKATSGVSFNSHKYCHENFDRGSIDYDDNKDIVWKDYGETEKLTKPVDLKSAADARRDFPSIFSYFLDGSRHTYKVDDMSYQRNVYPVIAGQIGVGCCQRVNRTLRPALSFERKLAIVLPDKAFSTDWDGEDQAKPLLEQINKNTILKNQHPIHFSELLIYDTNKDEKFEKKGIAKIQDYMIELEKQMVADLVAAGKLNESNYLIKDGSLDYQRVSSKKNKHALNLSSEHIRNNYRRVIGVSKSFDPTKCLVQGGGTNSNIIANLKPYQRTPAFRYESKRANVDFCIWYLRIRDARYTHSIFDGILKIEKIVITEKERVHGIDSDDINNITAYLINERNPVCYGADERWANHLYPVYLTEQYVKSKYLSNNLFLQLF